MQLKGNIFKSELEKNPQLAYRKGLPGQILKVARILRLSLDKSFFLLNIISLEIVLILPSTNYINCFNTTKYK